jgi:HlyD family secretion protein
MARQKKKIVTGCLVAFLAVLVIVIAVLAHSDNSAPFNWDTVSRGDIRETITASGEFQAKVKVNIGTSIMGEIKELYVKDGQDVRAGDPLVTIDPERIRQEYTQTKAALDAAKNEAERAKTGQVRLQEVFERMENLFNQGLVSDEDFRQARQNRDSALLTTQSAQAHVDQAYAGMKAMEDYLSKTKLVAPISGRVTGLIAEKGETAIPGQSNLPGATLMVISDMSEIIAEVKVNESDVIRTKVGQNAQVTAESLPGKVFPGKIVEVATASEKLGQGQDANMYKIKVALDMNMPDVNELRPGMSARAVIMTAEAKDVLRVPLQSVLEREGSIEDALKKGLFVPETNSVVMGVKGNKAIEMPVSVGIASTQYFELTDGLALGDKVITGPVRRLKDLKSSEMVKLRQKSDSEMEADSKRSNEKKP